MPRSRFPPLIYEVLSPARRRRLPPIESSERFFSQEAFDASDGSLFLRGLFELDRCLRIQGQQPALALVAVVVAEPSGIVPDLALAQFDNAVDEFIEEVTVV